MTLNQMKQIKQPFVDYLQLISSFVVVFQLSTIFPVLQVNHQDQLNQHQFHNPG